MPGISDIYDQSEAALAAACKDYETQVVRIAGAIAPESVVSSRVKTRSSLIRKLSKYGGDGAHSWARVRDKVGVRVVCSTKQERRRIARALESAGWASCARENKKARPQRLEYAGVHLTVDSGAHVDSLGNAIECEIQVRTRAQDAWSVVSHKLTYKGLIELPRKSQRVIWRASVLSEIFDDDIQRMFDRRESMAAYEEARALELLDARFSDIVGVASELHDLDIMRVIWQSYTADERHRFGALVEQFIEARPTLADELRSHQPGSRGFVESRDWLSTQPEILAILERASNNEPLLVEAVRNSELYDAITASCAAYGFAIT